MKQSTSSLFESFAFKKSTFSFKKTIIVRKSIGYARETDIECEKISISTSSVQICYCYCDLCNRDQGLSQITCHTSSLLIETSDLIIELEIKYHTSLLISLLYCLNIFTLLSLFAESNLLLPHVITHSFIHSFIQRHVLLMLCVQTHYKWMTINHEKVKFLFSDDISRKLKELHTNLHAISKASFKQYDRRIKPHDEHSMS
jgi:hypothetical protein